MLKPNLYTIVNEKDEEIGLITASTGQEASRKYYDEGGGNAHLARAIIVSHGYHEDCCIVLR